MLDRVSITVSDIAAAQTRFNGIFIPGMNAIAFTREVLAEDGEHSSDKRRSRCPGMTAELLPRMTLRVRRFAASFELSEWRMNDRSHYYVFGNGSMALTVS